MADGCGDRRAPSRRDPARALFLEQMIGQPDARGVALRRASPCAGRSALPVAAAGSRCCGGRAARSRTGSASRSPGAGPSSTRDDRRSSHRRPKNVALLRRLRGGRRPRAAARQLSRTRPEPTVAHRTSPTNIGMGLLATLAAHDLRVHRHADELVERIEATLTTIEGMERFEGHLLNWYDTLTLAPLAPRYVSTGRQRQPRRPR